MNFQWDAANEGHLAAHRVTTNESEEVFFNNPIEIGPSNRKDEERWTIVGPTNAGRILTVIYTVRPPYLRVVTGYTAKGKYLRDYKERSCK